MLSKFNYSSYSQLVTFHCSSPIDGRRKLSLSRKRPCYPVYYWLEHRLNVIFLWSKTKRLERWYKQFLLHHPIHLTALLCWRGEEGIWCFMTMKHTSHSSSAECCNFQLVWIIKPTICDRTDQQQNLYDTLGNRNLNIESWSIHPFFCQATLSTHTQSQACTVHHSLSVSQPCWRYLSTQLARNHFIVASQVQRNQRVLWSENGNLLLVVPQMGRRQSFEDKRKRPVHNHYTYPRSI